MFNWNNYLKKTPLIMGIINITPDSFSDGGHFFSLEEIHDRQEELSSAGVSIIDIGAQSTRPGSTPITFEEERFRISLSLPLEQEVLYSLDSKSSYRAKYGLQNGFKIINDIAGSDCNINMLNVVKDFQCGYIIGHIQGTPETMQNNPTYKNVVEEVLLSLQQVVNKALEIGISKDQLAVDPGIGFGKTFEHNLELFNNLDVFKQLEVPICLGISRKSFVKKFLENDGVEVNNDSLDKMSYDLYLQVQNNIDIIRVHNEKYYL
jgi:dihydropteroate synthase